MFYSLLNASNWATDIAKLFTNSYYIICLVCLAIGLILCAVECFIPGFGVIGITGLVFCTFSIVFLLVMDGTWRQFLFMIGIGLLVLTLVILIAVRSARFGALSKSPLVQKRTALPEDYSSDEKNYQYLVGKVGLTETICKPIGKAIIDGISYSVITNGEYLGKNKKIYVAEVEGTTIIVKENMEVSK
jgi:membrane-bound serine protease (ClpP class)